jgi:HD-like signal output (HDOD) protein/CheY-like chemotaxis protein
MGSETKEARRRILFVDDEPNILEGLQNILRKQRHRWEMVFALGAEPALKALAVTPFDVIVTDMRMPHMDGAALLTLVRERYPSVLRLVLSGHAERDAVLRAVPVAHQFLSKPCAPETLQVAIERACELRDLLQDERVRRLCGAVESLRSVPRIYDELVQLLARPEVGLDQVAALVETDPAMSAKVLQLVNSAYFGLPQRTTSVRHAVTCLGLELVRGLALISQVFKAAEGGRIEGFSVDRLQTDAVRTARLAKIFVADPSQRDEAFTAGIVHDVGYLVLAAGAPAELAAIIRQSTETDRPAHELERELLGTTHAEIGAYLLGLWGLPCSIVEAVARHHRPGLVTPAIGRVLPALHVAEALTTANAAGLDLAGPLPDLDLAFVESAGLAERLPTWRALAAAELGRD